MKTYSIKTYRKNLKKDRRTSNNLYKRYLKYKNGIYQVDTAIDSSPKWLPLILLYFKKIKSKQKEHKKVAIFNK